MNIFKSITDNILHFIAPRVCLVCGTSLISSPANKFICLNCIETIPLAPPGDFLIEKLELNFENKDDFYIGNLYSYFRYEEGSKYARLIHNLKYSGLWSIGTELGREFGKLLRQIPGFGYDALLPVPIHHARRRERGYNQAEVIAGGICESTGIPVDTALLLRKIYTTTQTKLSKTERRENVSKAFIVNDSIDIKGKSFLLIDDVLTTGSTLNACACALLEGGAKAADAATLATAG